jgi:hypothetical protein
MLEKDRMETPSRPHLFGLLAGLFLAAGLVGAAIVFTGTWMRISDAQSINVTGSARKNVRADLVVWRGTFSTEAATLLEAQRSLKADLAKVEAFMRGKDLTNFVVSAIAIQELYARASGDGAAQQTVGYRLSQTVEIRSEQVDRLHTLAGETTALVEAGVAFVPSAPEYIYTKAGEAKIEMLAEATKDAQARAEQIATQGGRHIAGLRSARMGVFQITPLYSTETSWAGVNDTSSLDKTITATVTASFSMK